MKPRLYDLNNAPKDGRQIEIIAEIGYGVHNPKRVLKQNMIRYPIAEMYWHHIYQCWFYMNSRVVVDLTQIMGWRHCHD